MSQTITQLVQQYKESLRQLRKKLEQDGTGMLEEAFKEIFNKHQGLKVFAFLGSTPSFNDGEPCTHSSETYIGGEFYYKQASWGNYWQNDWDDRELLTEVFLENYEDIDESEPPSEGNTPLLVNRECKTLSQAFKDIQEFEEAVEMVYGTNYLIIVRLEEDGSVSIDHEEYDCGY